MILAAALDIADHIRAELAPFCTRIEIAGSVRRQKPEVKDVEIVCIPRGRDLAHFADTVNRWTKIKGEPSGRYTQRYHPDGIMLDLFMTTPENWGAILLIRTGSADYSKWFMGTALPKAGYRQEGGYVRQNGVIVPTYEEEDVFRLAGVTWVEPEQRGSGC